MNYLYYPGCSLEGTAKEYDISTKVFMTALGVNLKEIPQWTCCGASAAWSSSFLLSMALPARVLALAEKTDSGLDVTTPCSACYLNLKKVTEKLQHDSVLSAQITEILQEENLVFSNTIKVKHLLQVMVQDIGIEHFQSRIKQSFAGKIIAPYYGCQVLRPYIIFDDPESPNSLEPFIKSTGAAVHQWDMGGKCCGANHINTKPEVGIKLVTAILEQARGADAIITVCPMCQMNLEAYQDKISQETGTKLLIPVLYVPQFFGLAMGLTPEELGLGLNLSYVDSFCKHQ